MNSFSEQLVETSIWEIKVFDKDLIKNGELQRKETVIKAMLIQETSHYLYFISLFL